MEVDSQSGAVAVANPGPLERQCPASLVVRSRFFGAELRPYERLDAPPPTTAVLAASLCATGCAGNF